MLILSPPVILANPNDVFPNMNIPVVAVGFTCTGLSREEMEARITTVYDRSLTTLGDNIQHTDSTRLRRSGDRQDLLAAKLSSNSTTPASISCERRW